MSVHFRAHSSPSLKPVWRHSNTAILALSIFWKRIGSRPACSLRVSTSTGLFFRRKTGLSHAGITTWYCREANLKIWFSTQQMLFWILSDRPPESFPQSKALPMTDTPTSLSRGSKWMRQTRLYFT